MTAITLPSTYTRYKWLEVIAGDYANTISPIYIRTAVLALVDNSNNLKLGYSDSDEAGSRKWLLWQPTARTLTRGGQGDTANAHIIWSARLSNSL